MRLLPLITSLALLCPLLATAADDPANGARVFDNKCARCHSMDPAKDKKGPHLTGVVGRAAGSVAGYKYSDAMAAAKFEWTPERLAAFIDGPRSNVPGTKMWLLFAPGAQDSADLIAWLQQQTR
ncbi:c-type cytochrome [Uliginosibacterium sp. 31-16]|uniref:c-type cytochrome n=1 Tax=Uliginosibacterium sp. 31-16 TaxID=3068315 RepID=UPI00273DB190|nr:c-type cytochrome [Uliginosibacterium sp. 31-16]MDP5240114.1 c-type cytochrome [Uliginosibacterium sp. 31-16]